MDNHIFESQGHRLSILALVPVVFMLGCTPRNDYAPPPAPTVSTATPIVADVPNYLVETGQTEAVGRSEVRTRVSGVFIKARKSQGNAGAPDSQSRNGESEFVEAGDQVEKGQLLFEIEKDEYIAAVHSAEAAVSAAQAEHLSAQANVSVAKAQIASAQATLTRADADFRRQEDLLGKNATSRQDYDRAKAELESAQATLAGYQANQQTAEADVTRAAAKIDAANADLEQAQLNLQYTDVEALIRGRLTSLDVKERNFVQANTVIATIVNDEQVWAYFNVSDAMVINLEDQRKKFNEANTQSPERRVELQRSGDKDFSFVGYIDYVDSEGFDRDSGTLRVRAKFDNADGRLIPGFFVRVRLLLDFYEDALLIPEQAVGRDQLGDYVYVIDEQDIAHQVHVTLGPKVDEWITVLEGLDRQSSVVVSGVQRVRDGKGVNPIGAENLPDPPALPANPSADGDGSPVEGEDTESN